MATAHIPAQPDPDELPRPAEALRADPPGTAHAVAGAKIPADAARLTPDEKAAELDARTHVLTDPRFELLIATVRANRPSDDTEIIRRAWEFCLLHHRGQLRASGEPYVLHPLEVAIVLAEMKLDSTAIAAGLLHDAVEDTPVTTADITKMFGEQVAHIVEGVTKLDKIQFANREDRQAESVRKMLLAMVTDVRVVLIKLADRLHNMRTLEHLKPDRQQGIARETLDIYAPLAHRLGMGKLRGELEDLAFRYVDPHAYQQVFDAVEERRVEGEQFLLGVEALLVEKLDEHHIKGRVEWRIKRLFSVNQKLQEPGATIDQVFDLLALRVIVDTVADCYAVLGLIHSTWRPVPGRIKDFIATPRANLYQSLHTTVMGEGGHQFEVQIRTEEMHRVAEEGIAAHWKYKSGGSPVSARDEQRLAWVRQLVEWQREMTDPNEFLSTLKIDLYPEEVYTFTPKGKVVVLPKDASPIDFAYAVHTEVGHSCVSAKVNGRIVPLRAKLKNGDIVEVVTQNGHTPSRDWLTYVKSSRARNKIKHWINEHQRERALEIGRKLLEREARKYKVALSKFDESDFARIAAEYSLPTTSDMMAAIGFGKYSARQVLNRLAPGILAQAATDAEAGAVSATPATEAAARRLAIQTSHANAETLEVEGSNDLLVYRARCCNPIRGEEIIGYVTRGKGVAVHGRSCPNVQNLLYESDRRIAVEWARAAGVAAGGPKRATYPVKLTVLCDDRPGMLREMTAIISEENTNIRSVDTKAGPNDNAIVEMTLDAEDLRHLNRLVAGLRRVPGVQEVQRSQKM
jgi:guanosine-3',5'-bis(diphosphate) 3'-pyrophosphohydrolase